MHGPASVVIPIILYLLTVRYLWYGNLGVAGVGKTGLNACEKNEWDWVGCGQTREGCAGVNTSVNGRTLGPVLRMGAKL